MSERYSSRLTRLPLLAQDNWHIWKLRLKVVVAGMGLRDAFSFPLVETEEEERDEEQDGPASVVISVLDGRYTHDCLRQDPETFRVWLSTLDAKAAQQREEAYALMIGAVHDNCIHLISDIPSDPAWAFSALWESFESSTTLGKAQLWCEFHAITLDSCFGDFDKFCAEITRISTSLAVLNEAPSDEMKLARLLVGLGENHDHVRTTLLMMDNISFSRAKMKIKNIFSA